VRRFLIDETTLRVCREALLDGLQGDQEDGFIDQFMQLTGKTPPHLFDAIKADLVALEKLTAAMGDV
jgi:hypothetical protein